MMVGGISDDNRGDVVIDGYVPESYPRLWEYIAQFQQENQGEVPKDISINIKIKYRNRIN